MTGTKKPTDTATLRQVAKWYYRDHVTKKEIAEKLKCPDPDDARPINKMLEEAEDVGVVRIDIPETVLDCGPAHELQQELPHLQEIIAVPDRGEGEDYGKLLRRWGVAAADYFDKLVRRLDEVHVGITGGETLFEFCEAVTTRRRENVHIYTTSLVGRGRLVPTASHIDPVVNATLLWAKCGRISGHIHYATVPPYDTVTREKIVEELRDLAKRRPIREALEDMDKINVVFAGLGLVKPEAPQARLDINKLTMTGLLEPMITPTQLREEGAIAEFSGAFFDSQGNGDERWQFFLAAGHYDEHRRGVEFYRRMVRDGKTVILIAGENKEPAIMPALRGKLFNVWITNQRMLNRAAGVL